MFPASIITEIVGPFANVFGWVLAGCYSVTHSYGLSIIMLTLAVMVVVFPLTRAGTRSMMRMQILQPELTKIRNRHKTQPGMSTEERQAARMALNEEMMALYKENGVNPTGGCLPLFLQFPVFIVLYDVIRGMTRSVPVSAHSHATKLSPQYIPKRTDLYHAVVSSHGVLNSFGLNLADSVRSPGGFATKIPYLGVILIAVLMQYISIWQITNRNPSAAQAPQQMQMVQKFMPLIFIVIYIEFPAGVGLYFIVSSLFRIGQQEYMYKHDKMIVASVRQIRERHAADAAKGGKGAAPAKGRRGALRAAAAGGSSDLAPSGSGRNFRSRLRDAAAGFQGGTSPGGSTSSSLGPNGAGGSSGGSPNGSQNGSSKGSLPSVPMVAPAARPQGSMSGGKPARKVMTPPPARSQVENRSRDKRRRRG